MYDMKTESIMYYFLFFGFIYIILSTINKKEENNNNFTISLILTILFSFYYSYITFPMDTLDTSNFWG
jgi:phosphate starvation-inducible membrane PsiE